VCVEQLVDNIYFKCYKYRSTDPYSRRGESVNSNNFV
jgi:hypothetical protein